MTNAALQTYAIVANFFLLMSFHPEVQMKAQKEIDKEIGAGCFISLADRRLLVYVGAVLQEVMRWYTVVPMSK